MPQVREKMKISGCIWHLHPNRYNNPKQYTIKIKSIKNSIIIIMFLSIYYTWRNVKGFQSNIWDMFLEWITSFIRWWTSIISMWING